MTQYVRTRWHLLDSLRGFTLINMVLYHFLYDVFIVYGIIPDWIRKTGTVIWQQWICSTFIIISSYVMTLTTGKKIPVPKARYAQVKREYMLYKGEE